MGEQETLPTIPTDSPQGRELAVYDPAIAALGSERARFDLELTGETPAAPQPADAVEEAPAPDNGGDVDDLLAMMGDPEEPQRPNDEPEKQKSKWRRRLGQIAVNFLPEELSDLFNKKEPVEAQMQTPASPDTTPEVKQDDTAPTGPDLKHPNNPADQPPSEEDQPEPLQAPKPQSNNPPTPEESERANKFATLREKARYLANLPAASSHFLRAKQGELISNMSGKRLAVALGLGITAIGISVFLRGDASDLASPEAASLVTDTGDSADLSGGLGDNPSAGEELRGGLEEEQEIDTEIPKRLYEPEPNPETEAIPDNIEMQEEYDPDVLNDNGYTSGTPYAKISEILNAQGLDSETIKELQSSESEYNAEYHQLVVEVLDHNGMTLDDATRLGAGDTLDLPQDEIQSFIDEWKPDSNADTTERATPQSVAIDIKEPTPPSEQVPAAEPNIAEQPAEQSITGSLALDNAIRDAVEALPPGINPEMYSGLQEYLTNNINKAESLYVGTAIPLQEASTYLATHNSLLIPSIDQGYIEFVENMRQLMQNLNDSDEL